MRVGWHEGPGKDEEGDAEPNEAIDQSEQSAQPQTNLTSSDVSRMSKGPFLYAAPGWYADQSGENDPRWSFWSSV